MSGTHTLAALGATLALALPGAALACDGTGQTAPSGQQPGGQAPAGQTQGSGAQAPAANGTSASAASSTQGASATHAKRRRHARSS